MNPHLKLHHPEPMDMEDRDYRVGAMTPLILIALSFCLGVALGWVAHAWIGG